MVVNPDVILGHMSIGEPLFEFAAAARGVDILDAQQQAAAGFARQVKVQQRRIGMAQMKKAVRARRETENGWWHDTSLVMPGLVPGIHVFNVVREACQVRSRRCKRRRPC